MPLNASEISPRILKGTQMNLSSNMGSILVGEQQPLSSTTSRAQDQGSITYKVKPVFLQETEREVKASNMKALASNGSCSNNHENLHGSLEDLIMAAYKALDCVELQPVDAARKMNVHPVPLSKMRSIEIPKPQLSFDVSIDNSDTPFIPPHTTKYIPISDPHPLENEILQGIAFEQTEGATKPVAFSASNIKNPVEWIDTQDALHKLSSELNSESLIAVDLQSANYRTFMGFTCLLEISTSTKDFIVDTLKLRSDIHGALAPIFRNMRIVKIFHGAASSVPSLERDFGIYVVRLFDTSLAAETLNLQCASLTFLLNKYCNITGRNAKKMERQDWRWRPLEEEILSYLRTKTRYLPYIYYQLRGELDKSQFEEVLVKSAAYSRLRYSKPRLTVKDSVKAALQAGFDNRQTFILWNLHWWRDRIARNLDECLWFILSNGRCLLLVSAMADEKEKLFPALGKPVLPYFLAENTEIVLQIIREAKNVTIDHKWLSVVSEIRKQLIEEEKRSNVEKSAKKDKIPCIHLMKIPYATLDRIHCEKISLAQEMGTQYSQFLETCKSRTPKPQLLFDTQIDNSDGPFIPPHTDSFIPETDPHPMEVLIEKGLKIAKSLPFRYPPTSCKPLDDKYPFQWVSTLEELHAMSFELHEESAIAVDLEHHNWRTFMGLTCLIQISSRTKDFIIDALKVRSEVHGALAPIFHDPAIVKVFHGAASDVTWLERDFGLYVVNLFDTYKACLELGLPSSSLSFLLHRYCDITIKNKKSMQLEDWRRRPLTDGLRKYAQTDTHYLLYIYERLREELHLKSGALHTVLDKSAKISRIRYAKPALKPKDCIKAALNSGFDNRKVYALYCLYWWRDRVARELDESTGYILSNALCLKVVNAVPNDVEKLNSALAPGKLPAFLTKNAKAVLDVIRKSEEDEIDPEWIKAVDEIRRYKLELMEKAARAKAKGEANSPEARKEDVNGDDMIEELTSGCLDMIPRRGVLKS